MRAVTTSCRAARWVSSVSVAGETSKAGLAAGTAAAPAARAAQTVASTSDRQNDRGKKGEAVMRFSAEEFRNRTALGGENDRAVVRRVQRFAAVDAELLVDRRGVILDRV